MTGGGSFPKEAVLGPGAGGHSSVRAGSWHPWLFFFHRLTSRSGRRSKGTQASQERGPVSAQSSYAVLYSIAVRGLEDKGTFGTNALRECIDDEGAFFRP